MLLSFVHLIVSLPLVCSPGTPLEGPADIFTSVLKPP